MLKRTKKPGVAMRLFLALMMAVPQSFSLYAEEAAEPEEVTELSEEIEEAPETEEVTEEFQDQEEITEPEEETVTEEEEVSEEVTEEEEPEEETGEISEEGEPEEEPAEEIEEPEETEEGTAQEPEPVFITLSQTAAELNVGESFTFEATVSGSEEEYEIVWTAGDPEILSVDENGTVTALKAGMTTVRASVLEGEVSAEAQVKVTAESGDVVFSEDSYEVELGGTVTVPYELSEGNYEDIVWTLSEEGIVEINTETEGKVTVTALTGGAVLVTAEISGSSSSFGVVVLEDDEEGYADPQAIDEAKAESTVTTTVSVSYNQSSARELAALLNNYRWNSAHVSPLTYDYTVERYAMQRAAEIAVSFSHTRPNGKDWVTAMGDTAYRSGSTVSENILYSSDGSMATASQMLNRMLADANQRTKSLRATNKSTGVGHAIINGIDYWVVIFCDINAKDISQTSPLNGAKDLNLIVRSGLYSSPAFTPSKTVLKVKVYHSVSLPSVNGTVRITMGGQSRNVSCNGFTVSWTLDSVAKIYVSLTSDGKVKAGSKPNNDETAYMSGKATLNGSSYSLEKKVQIKVIQPVTGVSMTPTTASIDLGKTVKLLAEVKPDNATDKSVTWKSSNTKIATVSNKGVVTAKKGGTCTITVTTNDGGFTATCKITVIVHPTNIAFSLSELTMTVGMSETLVPVFTPKDTTDKKVTYTSSDSAKVKVASDGTVTALKVTGDDPVTITVKTHDGGLTAELPVTVKDKDQVKAPEGSYLWMMQYEIPLENKAEAEAGFVNTMLKGDEISLYSPTKDAVVYYTTDGSKPTADSTMYTGPIAYAGGDMTIRAIAVKPSQMKDSEIVEFVIGEEEEPLWEILDEDLEKLKDAEGHPVIPSGLWVAGISESASYSGSKITFPGFRVYYRTRLLTKNTDYKIAYKNNVNVCTPADSKACTVTPKENGSWAPGKNTKVAYVTITGKGNYKGSTYAPFTIEPVAISEENGFSYQAELYRSIGTKAISPVPVILWNGKKLKNKTDFVVVYSRDAAGTDILEGGITEEGEYFAIISGVKNFTTGENKIAVPVHVKAEAVLLSKTTVKIKNVEYTGEPIDLESLEITVKNGKTVLEKGTDYVIDSANPENPTDIGTVTLKIKGAEGSNYIGEKTASFKITGKSIAKATVYCLNTTVAYTGKPITLEELYKTNPKRPDLASVTLVRNGETLTENVDYTVEVSGQNKGKGTVRFRGIGAYTGTVTKKYTITQRQLKKDDVLIYVMDMNFTKTGARPFVFVLLKSDPDDPEAFPLEEGGSDYYRIMDEKTEYSVKYFNNKKIYTDDTYKIKNPPSVSVIFKGNFKGTIANNRFLIMSEDISYMRINCADSIWGSAKKGSKNYVKPTVYDFEGKKLVLNKDYKLTYYYAQDARVNGSATYNRAYGTAIRATDVPEPGTVIGVEVTGIGSYYGTLKTEYKVVKKASSLASATVTMKYQNGKNKYFEYTGGQIVPQAENMTVKLGKKTLVYGVDFEIKSLSNNIKAGKATMVLRGIGDYGGTKKVTFSIGKQSLVLDLGNLIRNLLGLSGE